MIKIILIAIITLGIIACDGNSGKELIETATNDNFEEAKLLVEQKADVNANDKDGVTALMKASYNEHLEIVKLLIEKGADVNIKDSYGRTALDLAKTEEIKEVLIKAGAK